jgi:hypothetical protein
LFRFSICAFKPQTVIANPQRKSEFDLFHFQRAKFVLASRTAVITA